MLDRIPYLKMLISRYRIFICKYLGITKSELLILLGIRMKRSEESLHLKNINDEEDLIQIIKELKVWKKELTGSVSLKKHISPRELAKKQIGDDHKMKVVEIFNSIDGEGKRTGELTTFIRLFGCNLRLPGIVIVLMLVK